MKIGAFSQKYQVSIDTIRHYMDLGLLYPQKINGQYEFDDFMCIQMGEILAMKAYGLSLAEIGHYMYYNRLSSLDSRDFTTDIRFFESKKRRIRSQIKELESYESNIKKRIESYKDKVAVKKYPIGVSIFDIPLLVCPKCKGELILNGGQIIENQIFEGMLNCSCGYFIRIRKGVIINGDYQDEELQSADFDIVEYINETPMDYYNILTMGMEWMRNRYMDLLTIKEQTVTLELGSGHGIFIRSCHQKCVKQGIYISSEIDPGRLFYLKELLEYFEPNGRKLFILGDFKNLPLKRHSVDILLDMISTSLDINRTKEHALKEVLPLWKNDGHILIAHLVGEKIGVKSLLSDETQKYMNPDVFLNLCKEQGIVFDEWKTSKILPIGGKYEQISMEGDRIRFGYGYGHRK